MNKILLIIPILLLKTHCFSHIDTLQQRRVSMSDTYVKLQEAGRVYFEKTRRSHLPAFFTENTVMEIT